MLNCRIKGEGFNSEEPLNQVAISAIKTKSCQMFQLLNELEARSPSCCYELSFFAFGIMISG